MARPVRKLLLIVLLLGAALSAQAASVTLAPATIQGFTALSSTGAPITAKTNETALGASFTTLWGFTVNGTNSVDVGATGLGLDWSTFDSFELLLANDNENDWNFSVSVSDGVDTNTSAVASLAPDSVLNSFTVSLAGLAAGSIDSVFVTVSGDLPVGGDDRTAEYTISAVPVPAAVWLFASALGGLGWFRRR